MADIPEPKGPAHESQGDLSELMEPSEDPRGRLAVQYLVLLHFELRFAQGPGIVEFTGLLEMDKLLVHREARSIGLR